MTIRAAIAGLLLAPVAAFAGPSIERVTTPGGLEAWLVEERAIPMVAIEISFAGGASLDPAEEAGAAQFLAAMLEEGAGDLDAVAFSEAAQALGARFGFSASRDSFSVSARVLVENLDESIDLLRLALAEPRFDDAPLARVRAQTIAGIRRGATDPNTQASLAFFAEAFPDDAYGRPVAGFEETVATIDAARLTAAWERHLNRDAAVIGVVGAVDAETLAPLLERLFDALPAAERPALPAVEPALAGGVTVIDLDAPQSTVMFGHAGLLRDDPDFIAAFVMNHILGGGGFSSRLMTEVRQNRGLAYSTYAYLLPLDRAGLTVGGVGTANERVAESISVIRDEWRRMAEDGPTEEELDSAIRFLTGAYALRFDSNAAVARALVGLQRDDLGIDYIARRNDLVAAVTVDDVRQVAARVLDPDALHFVVVGQPEGLADTPIVQ
ncbi:MAG: insulinase family protein [Rhodobacteraceae bacterium]|nr:MAG: insulinase family protein [Paracoccaceae bacterium]